MTVPSKRFHSTQQNLSSGVGSQPHSFLDFSFSEEVSRNGPVTGTVMDVRYKRMLEITFAVSHLQQWQCLDPITFMQAPPHIQRCVQRFLQQRFVNDKVICRAFPNLAISFFKS